ncbi:MAG: hypothetical protein IKZ13_09815 [Akkermansia sp.]|nr:hypothetical protein [Akkermansia sp.]
MKTKTILCSLALGGLSCLPQVQAQAGYGYDFTEDEAAAGYDFTDDEAEADRKAEALQKQTQQLIYNGAQYVSTCRKAYQEDIVWVVSACCDGIIGTEDFVDCIYDPVPADLHREALAKVMARHPFAADSGQFLQGPLSRATLNQAKPNMSSAQYTEIEHMITRSEMLMKWFTGRFAKACAMHNYDFLKEVQRVARFKEYLKSAAVEELGNAYLAMIDSFRGNYVRTRIDKAYSEFNGNSKRWSPEFFRHFHNSISSQERDSWLGYIVLGRGGRSPYNGPNFGVEGFFMHMGLDNPHEYLDIRGGKAIWAPTTSAAELASYMRYFEFWSANRITATEELGFNARSEVKRSADEFYKSVAAVAAEIVVKEDADFKRTVNNHAQYALNKLVMLDDELLDFQEYLKKNTNFIKNRERTKTYGPLLTLFQQRVDEANRCLNSIQKTAEQHVPAQDASRQSD